MDAAEAYREPSSGRVLVLSEDASLRARIAEALRPPTYLVRVLPDSGTRLSAEDWQPELVVVDVETISSNNFMRRHANRDALPTIAITPSSDPALKLRAFAYGADDVVAVPFAPEELAARVSALLRRTRGKTARPTPILTVGSLQIDLLHRRVRVDDHELRLSALEQSLLYLLASNAGRTMSRQAILDNLWGHDSPVESNVVDRHIHLLRRKLRALKRGERLIETVPGRGYRFTPG